MHLGSVPSAAVSFFSLFVEILKCLPKKTSARCSTHSGRELLDVQVQAALPAGFYSFRLPPSPAQKVFSLLLSSPWDRSATPAHATSTFFGTESHQTHRSGALAKLSCSNYTNPSLYNWISGLFSTVASTHRCKKACKWGAALWVDVLPDPAMPSGISVLHSSPYIRRTSRMDWMLAVLLNTQTKKAWALPWTIFAFESILYCLLASWRSDAVIRGWRTVILLRASI